MEMHVFEASLYDTQYQFFSEANRAGSGRMRKSTVIDAYDGLSLPVFKIDALFLIHFHFTTDGHKKGSQKGMQEEFNEIKTDRVTNATRYDIIF